MPKPEFTVEEKCRMFDLLRHLAERYQEIESGGWVTRQDPESYWKEATRILLGKENGW